MFVPQSFPKISLLSPKTCPPIPQSVTTLLYKQRNHINPNVYTIVQVILVKCINYMQQLASVQIFYEKV